MATRFSTKILSLLTVTFTTTSLLLPTATEAQQPLYNFCSDFDSNYSTNSTYSQNLGELLGSLLSAARIKDGSVFSTNHTGEVPDRVHGLAMCRGDTSPVDCTNCLKRATSNIATYCPFRRSGMVWYDNCFLRYSDQRFLGTVDNSSQRVYMWEGGPFTKGVSLFNTSVRSALLRLAQYAARNDSARPIRFAAGQMELGEDVGFQKLYGMVQCTGDLSADDCNSCLGKILADLPSCCSGKEGGRILAASCNFRYGVTSFYSWSSALSLPVLQAALSPPQSSVPVAVPGNKRKKTILAVTITLVIAFCLLIMIGCIFFQKCKTTEKKIDGKKTHKISAEGALLFDLSAIEQATNNFSPTNKLGEGGFGVVFKGMLADGQEIAVKRLSANSGQGVMELRNEVILLAKLQHRNLVGLLGLCLEGGEKLLVYEYVPNKSLDTFLFDPIKKRELYWERRYNIITGIARGLLYLHEESQQKIIHRDLKAANVLLDAEMKPKISDFGLARLFGVDQAEACTNRVVGTFGYMPPEYAMSGQFSVKSDVFSFGVLVLEIVTGMRSNHFPQSEIATNLLCHVWDHWSRESAVNIMDPSLDGNFPLDGALRCIEIGLLCVQEAPHLRPTMSKVDLMLNSFSVSTHVPTQPAFLVHYSRAGQVAGSEIPNMCSGDEQSVTELEPR